MPNPNGTNGREKLEQFSKHTLLPFSIVMLIAALAWAGGATRASLVDGPEMRAAIEKLESEFEKQLEKRDLLIAAQVQKISDYRAQVDGYRTEDFKQTEKLTALTIRVAKLEGR